MFAEHTDHACCRLIVAVIIEDATSVLMHLRIVEGDKLKRHCRNVGWGYALHRNWSSSPS
ncbi:MAG: hypothetical protein ACK4Z8_09825 [Novosphingobium sp.]